MGLPVYNQSRASDRDGSSGGFYMRGSVAGIAMGFVARCAGAFASSSANHLV